ncbi:MAG: hypothetical protein AB7U45_03885 [Desulfamplus sp.]
MPEPTQDKWLNFVIENYDDIQSMLEVYNFAKVNLPDHISSIVMDSINELKQTYFEENGLVVDTGDDCIYWYDKDIYDSDSEIGVFFEFDSISIKDWKLITPNTASDFVYFYLYINPEGKSKKLQSENIEKLQKKIREHKNILEKNGIVVLPNSNDTKMLAHYYLNSVNIKALQNPEKLKSDIQNAVQNFTTPILELLRLKF